MRVCAVVLTLLTLVSSCDGCSGGTAKTVAPPDPHTALAADLFAFTAGEPLPDSKATQKGAALKGGSLSVDRYVDELLSKDISPRIARDLLIAPNVGPKDRHPVPAHNVLKSTNAGGKTIFYLREACDASTAVSVTPWWDDDAVLVCPDSYRPEIKGDDAGRTCGASMLPPQQSSCGCGPRLAYCVRDREQHRLIKDAINDELTQTADLVVNSDKPIEELFTMNGSVRNGYAEYVYRRARIAAGEPETIVPIEGFSKKAKLHPRHEQVPGQHAGVLSTPVMTYASDALRGVMRNYSEILWCSGVGSSRVTTEGVMELEVVDLRTGDGWKQLASMPICTDCHARLDYSMQFFWGYPSSTMGVDFRPSDALSGKGQFYMNDIKDDRGEDDLSPAGFARLAVAQPEFAKCVTRKVVDHVFNGTDDEADYKAVLESFKETHRLKGMLRVAMTRYAHKALAPPSQKKAPIMPAANAVAGDGSVPLTKPLREALDQHCSACHDKGDAFDYSHDALPRATLMAMMDQVGFRVMPQTAQGLDDDDRTALLTMLAPLAYPTPKDSEAALAFYGSALRAAPVHRFRTAMQQVHASAGGKDNYRPGSIESSLPQGRMTYTPGIALSQAVVAVKACKGKSGSERDACLAKATAPSTILVGGGT